MLMIALTLTLGAGLLGQPAALTTVAAACAPAIRASTTTLATTNARVSAVRVVVQADTTARPANLLRSVRVTSSSNAVVIVQGQRVTLPTTVTPATGSQSLTFDVRQQATDRSFEAYFVSTDSCGDVPSFAGAGTGPSSGSGAGDAPVEPTPGIQPSPLPSASASPTPIRTPTTPPSQTATPTPTGSATPTVIASPIGTPIQTVTPPPSVPAGGYVTRSGTQFLLSGAPFEFVGANMYNAAGDPTIYECGPWMSNPDTELDAWFAQARADFGGRVIRFWAYQRYTNGGTDWRALDRVMRLAAAHDLKVLPVLENQWGDCSDEAYKDANWYAGGYRQPYGQYAISYDAYVRRVVERYRDEPAIFGWMLMNEAESRVVSGPSVPDALFTFARDMSALVKSIDANHLVTLGVIGGGQPGVDGTDYERLHQLSTIDFATFHDYGHNDQALPGAPVRVQAPVQTALYGLDQQWAWSQSEYRSNQANAWEEFTWTIPGGAQPFRQIGLAVYGSFTGAVYVDQVRIGDRTYSFEDGTLQGWQTAAAAVSLSPTADRVYDGARSLKLTFNQVTGLAQVWVPPIATDGAATTVSVRIYVETPGTPLPYNTLAVAMYKAATWLNKPVIVGEAGMTACGSWNGSQAETAETRAAKMRAKMQAFFGNGGAGYLVWAWEPNNACNFAFGPGDPLNAVLRAQAGALAPPQMTAQR